MANDDFDLDQTIARAWEVFEHRLAEVLSVMDDEAELNIGTLSVAAQDPAHISFTAVPGMSTTRGEPVINAEVSLGFAAGENELKKLANLGWVVEPNCSTIHKVAPQAAAQQLSSLAVVTLRDIIGVQHPVFLSPDQLAEILHSQDDQSMAAESEQLSLEPSELVAVMPQNTAHLIEMVVSQVQQIYGYRPIIDSDGEITVRVGSSVVFIMPTADRTELVLLAPLVHDVEGRTRAAEVINDLNESGRYVRYFVKRDRVYAQISIFTKPFVPAHFHQALMLIARYADGLDDELANKLHGKTTFQE